MIIFGTRGVTTTPQRGTFHCPECGPGCRYEMKRVRRFFTLYFIPVIPLDKLGEFVECKQCRGTYKSSVLRWEPPPALDVQAEFNLAITRIMALVALADGKVEDSEIDAMGSVLGRLTGSAVPRDELLDHVRRERREKRSVADCLRTVGPHVNEKGKELIVKAAFMVAGADGHVDESEMRIVNEAAQVLGMTTAHLKGVIAEAHGALE